MCHCLQSTFFGMYPAKQKVAWTSDGRALRKSMIMALIVHTLLFFFSFAVVGFNSMILNLSMCA